MIQELLIVLFFFTACADPVQQNGNYKIEVSEKESTNNQNQKKITENNIRLNHIRLLYSKYPKANFPFNYQSQISIAVTEYRAENKIDTLVFGDQMPCNIIGVIPDTSKFFGFLYLAALDDATPSIVTYDKRGNLITRQQLTKSCYQGCESDCRSIITIDKNLKIKFRYEEYLFDSDDDVSNCSEFPDYASGYVEYSHIDRNGKVKKDKLDSLKYKELMKNPIVHKKE